MSVLSIFKVAWASS